MAWLCIHILEGDADSQAWNLHSSEKVKHVALEDGCKMGQNNQLGDIRFNGSSCGPDALEANRGRERRGREGCKSSRCLVDEFNLELTLTR